MSVEKIGLVAHDKNADNQVPLITDKRTSPTDKYAILVSIKEGEEKYEYHTLSA
jgi:hypothetical protein